MSPLLPPLSPPLPRPSLAWRERAVDDNLVDAIAAQHALPRSVARVLVGRGVTSLEGAATYLQPRLNTLPDPMRLAGIEAAVDRLEHALVHGQRIGVFGDYDVDGVTSTTLLSDFLEAVGGDVAFTIPDRLVEGYGLSRAGVDRLIDAGCRLIVTVDCGVTNHDEVAYAAARGVDVIVVDHHTVPVELPRAFSVINPHRVDCTRGSEMLCAVGVTFNLALAVRRRLRERDWFTSTRPEPDLKNALDLVALGTVADVVPLVGENRVLVHAGLQQLRQGRRPGLRALLDVAGVDPARVDAGDLGFQIGPRVNAAGRLGDAMQGVWLLKGGVGDVTRSLAAALDAENAARRALVWVHVTGTRDVVGTSSANNAEASAAAEPSHIPMPALDRDSVDLASLEPGRRVMLLVEGHVIALDVVDGPAGELLEHRHVVHADRTVTVASTAVPRRIKALGSSGAARFGGLAPPHAAGRIARGEWLQVVPAGQRGKASPELIGPIQAVGVE